jgi:hypothetical protein
VRADPFSFHNIASAIASSPRDDDGDDDDDDEDDATTRYAHRGSSSSSSPSTRRGSDGLARLARARATLATTSCACII